MPGNINLARRPVVRNHDGSVSTVRSISIGVGKHTALIPTVIGHRVVSNEIAIKHFQRTHQHLGIFDSSAAADRYAEQLHESQARRYAPDTSRSRALAQREGGIVHLKEQAREAGIGLEPRSAARDRAIANRLISDYESGPSAGNLGHALERLGHVYEHNPVSRNPIVGRKGLLGGVEELVKSGDPIAMGQALARQRHPIRAYHEDTAAGRAATAAYRRGDITREQAIEQGGLSAGVVMPGIGRLGFGKIRAATEAAPLEATAAEQSSIFGREKVSRPRTPAEASARLAQLDKQIDAFHVKARKLTGHEYAEPDLARAEQLRRNKINGLIDKFEQTGKRSAGTGKALRAGRKPKVSEELHKHTLDFLDKIIARNPEKFGPYIEAVAERHSLQQALHGHMPGEEPGAGLVSAAEQEHLRSLPPHAPGGVAARAAGAAPDELADMVASGEKPSAVMPHSEDASKALELVKGVAEARGLKYRVLKLDGDPVDPGPFYQGVIARDQAALDRLTRAWTAGGSAAPTAEVDAAIGRALGYSEEDIATYLARNHGVREGGGAGDLGTITEERLAPGERVRRSLGNARTLRAEQKQMYSAEWGKRVEKAEAAREAAGGGLEGHAAAMRELRGELPKTSFEKLRSGNLTQDDLERLVVHIDEHPELAFFEKRNTATALIDAYKDGRTPAPFEIKLLQRVFGKEATDAIVETSRLKQAGNLLVDVLGIPRSFMASVDVSAPFRQGLVAMARHPVMSARNFPPMFKALVSEGHYQSILQDIHDRPNFDLYGPAGLKFTELGRDPGVREEGFQSPMAERLNIKVGGKRIGPGRVVHASGRAYTGFLDKMRADMFDRHVELARKAGVNVEDLKQLKSIAKFVNSATGRGNLGPIESWAPALNALFFSPRLMASRINFLNPLWYATLTPYARAQAIRSLVQLGSSAGLLLGTASFFGAKVATDPRNADFAKLRVGNTRFDVLGGFQQYVRVGSQLGTKKIISSTTGETLKIGEGDFGSLSYKDIADRFLSAKFNPPVSFINDFATGTDFAGQPFDVKKAVLQRTVPLVMQDAYSTYHNYKSVKLAVLGYAISAFGIGTQTYGPQPPKVKHFGGGSDSSSSNPFLSGGGSDSNPYLSGGGSSSSNPYLP